MIEIRELPCEIKFVDIDVHNYVALNPLDVLEGGKQIRVMIAATDDLLSIWAFEDITMAKIMLIYPMMTPWMALAAMVVISSDGCQRVLRDVPFVT